MSIDDYAGGPGRGAASLLHRNRGEDFPDWAGRDLDGQGVRLRCLAADGATVGSVLHDQLPLLGDDVEIVTVTMGGNDLLAAYGDGAAAGDAIARVASTGAAVLGGLRRHAPAATVVLSTVYDPSDGTGAGTTALPPWPQGPSLLAELNTVLVGLAGRFDAALADIHAHFHGHGAATADPAQPDPRPANRDLWYCGVVEPNTWGAHQIRTCWWHTLADHDWRPLPER